MIQSAPPPAPATGGLSLGAIIGIAVGGFVALLLLGGLIAWLVYRTKAKKKAEIAAAEELAKQQQRDAQLAAQNQARSQGFVANQASPNNIAAASVPYNVPPPDYAGQAAAAAIPLIALPSSSQPQATQGSYLADAPAPAPPALPASANSTMTSMTTVQQQQQPISAATSTAPSVQGVDLSAFNGQQCTATRPYNAKYADELELRPGDAILCEKVHEDGWGQVGFVFYEVNL